jgi:hypothetical protein
LILDEPARRRTENATHLFQPLLFGHPAENEREVSTHEQLPAGTNARDR